MWLGNPWHNRNTQWSQSWTPRSPPSTAYDSESSYNVRNASPSPPRFQQQPRPQPMWNTSGYSWHGHRASPPLSPRAPSPDPSTCTHTTLSSPTEDMTSDSQEEETPTENSYVYSPQARLSWDALIEEVQHTHRQNEVLAEELAQHKLVLQETGRAHARLQHQLKKGNDDSSRESDWRKREYATKQRDLECQIQHATRKLEDLQRVIEEKDTEIAEMTWELRNASWENTTQHSVIHAMQLQMHQMKASPHGSPTYPLNGSPFHHSNTSPYHPSVSHHSPFHPNHAATQCSPQCAHHHEEPPPPASPSRVVELEFVEKVIEVEVPVEKLVEVPVEKMVEKIVEVIVEVPKIVERIVEVPTEKCCEELEELKQLFEEAQAAKVALERRITKLQKLADEPRIVHVEKIVEVPTVVERIVERAVEKIVERPTERIVEKIVDRPVETIVEKVIERPVEVFKEVVVEKPVIKEVPTLVEVPVEKVVEIQRLVEVEKRNPEMERELHTLRQLKVSLERKLHENEVKLSQWQTEKERYEARILQLQLSLTQMEQDRREAIPPNGISWTVQKDIEHLKENELLKEKMKETESTVRTLNAENEMLLEETNEKKNEISQLEQKVQALQKEFESLQAKNEKTKDSPMKPPIGGVMSSVGVNSGNNSNMGCISNEEFGGLKKTVEDMEFKLQDSEATLKGLKAENIHLLTETTTQNRKIIELETQLTHAKMGYPDNGFKQNKSDSPRLSALQLSPVPKACSFSGYGDATPTSKKSSFEPYFDLPAQQHKLSILEDIREQVRTAAASVEKTGRILVPPITI